MERRFWEKAVASLLTFNWVVMTAIVAGGAGVWLLLRKQLPPQVPLFYSLPWGEEQLANPVYLLLPAGLALGLGVAALVAGMKMRNEIVLAALLTTTAVAAELILALGLLRIVTLVT